MISNKSMANAVGGKTARACDSCIKKRARWYCAADDAFLCQSCDSSVHSANPLARRHERVRLKTASLKSLDLIGSKENTVPSWHQGFTRKARTPRHGKSHNFSKVEETLRNPFPLVPEVGSDEISHEENEEEHLLYRVPIFDPLVAELCTSTTNSNEAAGGAGTPTAYHEQSSVYDGNNGIQSKSTALGLSGDDLQGQGFLPSDMDLAEFAADVESLLGRGLENESFGMEELGLMDCREEELLHREHSFESGKKVKLEEQEEDRQGLEHFDDTDIDMGKEPPFELSFDYDSPATCEEEDDHEKLVTEKKEVIKIKSSGEYGADVAAAAAANKKRKKLLRLDYEGVITAWASQGSPWANGNRPDFDLDQCWPDCMGTCGIQLHHPCDILGGLVGHPAMADGGREARVSRYREKRRTRLFSKKIRYEVRKLNAEKRPRMKGRFVKRATFTGPAFPLLKISTAK
ncbi:hypothetical protein Tsubulata_031379 [Turnera subulata]|uniref:B box-type domain-containing protein n=1 Tax=Turnera subulata TaxID=218843 RepID=A0A9Q0JPC1_9ROSI|nr:hypothetical protein Tsubulata_031379 [Turnera subulata]